MDCGVTGADLNRAGRRGVLSNRVCARARGRRMDMKTLALVFATLASHAANADELSAGQLYAFCTSTDAVATAACRFYILGVVQGIGMGDGATMGADRKLRSRNKTHFCIPDEASQARMVAVFQDTVRLLVTKYPEDLKSPAVSIVDAAMNHAFPCPRSN
jgi:hypothetical protein